MLKAHYKQLIAQKNLGTRPRDEKKLVQGGSKGRGTEQIRT